ncbi:YeiH family protein [Aliikangiella sp. G2MR2-5]|uniref:YeiH family protein n=1 Tax=Aliikangiella sp. G2MR2-5 TaxID=2788943 RepID=UPI0018A8C688|nr:putative sulfate exporter family transporter [Aliikangiella sp. G2MR2-5]
MARFSEKISLFFLVLSLFAIASGLINFSFSLILGFFYAIVLGNPYQLKTQWASGHILKISIVLMGFGLNIQEIAETARSSFWITIITISFAMTAGLILGRLFNVDSRLSFLVSGGTAICGGSAIAALAPAIKARPTHLLISISIVFLLNAAGLLAYPYIGEWLELSQSEFGLWAALGIHDTSSVVGAAAEYGEESLKVATTTKLARALWIIPLVFIAGYAFRHEQSKSKLPVFILFFVGASLIASFVPSISTISSYAPVIAKRGMAISLFLIGSGFNQQTLKEIESSAFWQGLLLWILVSVSALALIKWL